MIKVVGIRFQRAGKIYYFDPLDYDLETAMHVIVETARGVEYGLVIAPPMTVRENKIPKQLISAYIIHIPYQLFGGSFFIHVIISGYSCQNGIGIHKAVIFIQKPPDSRNIPYCSCPWAAGGIAFGFFNRVFGKIISQRIFAR